MKINRRIIITLFSLSVFFVAVTRVKKDLFLSASKTRYSNSGKMNKSKVSCLAFLPGVVLEYI